MLKLSEWFGAKASVSQTLFEGSRRIFEEFSDILESLGKGNDVDFSGYGSTVSPTLDKLFSALVGISADVDALALK
jgi:hypothetical protein